MNAITNDKGELVTAIGMPGSMADVINRYPKLIADLNKMYEVEYHSYGRGIDLAIKLIRSAKVEDEHTTSLLLQASRYNEERPESVTNLVLALSNSPVRGQW